MAVSAILSLHDLVPLETPFSEEKETPTSTLTILPYNLSPLSLKMWSSEVGGDTAGLEFRSYQDEAWYNVTVGAEGESVRVRFAGFPTHDNVFGPGDFGLDPKRVDDFAARFRPVSVQLQDSQCRRATSGLLVCASHHFGQEDVRFYDALIDSVQSLDSFYLLSVILSP